MRYANIYEASQACDCLMKYALRRACIAKRFILAAGHRPTRESRVYEDKGHWSRCYVDVTAYQSPSAYVKVD